MLFCDNGKVLLISNNDKRQIDISIEITGEDERKIRELNSFFKETTKIPCSMLLCLRTPSPV